MDIYIPFTYIIGWSNHKKFYYGCKYAEGCQPSNLWESYFTSSGYVEEFRKEFGEPDIIRIHRTFNDAKECVLFEHKYLTRIDAKNNDLFLNKTNGNEKFNTAGHLSVRDKTGKTFYVSLTDPRYLSGELVPIAKGYLTAKDKSGNTLRVSVEDERFLNGELVALSKGKVSVKDKEGNKLFVSIDDPRYLSGELIQCTKGTVVVKSEDGETFRVDVNDPRYLSGEFVSVYTGFVNVKDKNGNTSKVSIDDPRYISGELVHILTGVTPTHKECHWCNKSVPAPLFGRWHGDKCLMNPKNKGVIRSLSKEECPHCGRFFDAGNFKKYHGDNCKLNPQVTSTLFSAG